MSSLPVAPVALRDAANRCCYCYRQATITYPVDRRTGILACDLHTEAGRRDWGAYMTAHGRARVCDAAHQLPEFFGLLSGHFTVREPGPTGLVKDGWRLNTEGYITIKGDDCFIPIFKRSGLADIGRQIFGSAATPQEDARVSIRAFRDPAVGIAGIAIPGMTKATARAARKAIVAGLYVATAAAATAVAEATATATATAEAV